MTTATRSARKARSRDAAPHEPPLSQSAESTTATQAGVPGQVVLVLQGGGALGAYQVGVYEALTKRASSLNG